jgi:hypothetical protein
MAAAIVEAPEVEVAMTSSAEPGIPPPQSNQVAAVAHALSPPEVVIPQVKADALFGSIKNRAMKIIYLRYFILFFYSHFDLT